MEHQDWETFVIHCKTPKNDKTTKETKHHEKTKDRKIEEMEEKGVLTHKKLETSLSKIIQQARVEKGWTQKELANKVALSPAIINEIESGKAKYNPAHINKLKLVLKIKKNNIK